MKNLLLALFVFQLGICFSQTKNEFSIANSDPISKMSVLDIESLYSFKFGKGSVRIIVGGSGGATDYGPYRSAYLIFDNGTEMPWRYASYELGSFGSVEAVSKKSPSEILLKVNLYSKLEDCDCSFSITIDLSDVLEKEKLLGGDWTEGSIASQIQVLVEEITE